MEYGLPESVKIGDEDYAIRYDFRVVLDIFEALNMEDAPQLERLYTALNLFYLDYDALPDGPYHQKAMEQMFRFINGGKPEKKQQQKQQQLVDWRKDYPYICAAVNRVLGYELRAVPYDMKTNKGGVHWYTFLAGYMEIGDCLFSQIVGIRAKKAKNKKLDAGEQEFYRQNKDLIDIKTKYTNRDLQVISMWT